MFATSDRVRPCSARCSARSVGRRTRSSSPSWTTSMSRDLRSWRSPRGPATRTSSGSTVTLTLPGTGMGFLPIRDIATFERSGRLSDVGDDFAAHAVLAGLVARHDALRGGQDRGAHAAEDLRDALGVHVGAATGARDALEARDHRDARLGVLELHAQRLARQALAGRDDLVRADVALLL